MPAEPFIGEIMVWGGNYAPYGWAFCAGQLLPISQNTALFSLLGTNYGGDGRTTFGLPDLRGRMPMHVGGSNPSVQHRLGERNGTESVALNVLDLPEFEGDPAVDATTPPPGNRIDLMPPYLVLSFVIALWGVYPSRW